MRSCYSSSEGPHPCQLSHPLASLEEAEEEAADDETPLVLITSTIEPPSELPTK